MDAGKKGVKEIQEALVGVMELSCLLASLFRDGVQAEDFLKLFSALKDDPKFAAAFAGLKEIPEEVKDLDLSEGMMLAMVMLPYVPKFVESLKKKAE